MLTWLELKIPPPLLLLLLGSAMFLAGDAADLQPWTLPRPLGSALLLLGVLIDVICALAFWRRHTTINPLHPENSAVLVTSGLYRFSRNPMYVGQALVLLGWGLLQAHPVSLLLWPLFPAYLTRFQIKPEEQRLHAHFGTTYANYCLRVRRWL